MLATAVRTADRARSALKQTELEHEVKNPAISGVKLTAELQGGMLVLSPSIEPTIQPTKTQAPNGSAIRPSACKYLVVQPH